MAIIITKIGNSTLKIDDSTRTEPYYFNFNDIVLRSNGDNMIVSQNMVVKKDIYNVSVAYTDVTTPSGTTSGENLVDTVAALF
jgi:hypothetical protein